MRCYDRIHIDARRHVEIDGFGPFTFRGSSPIISDPYLTTNQLQHHCAPISGISVVSHPSSLAAPGPQARRWLAGSLAGYEAGGGRRCITCAA